MSKAKDQEIKLKSDKMGFADNYAGVWYSLL